MFIAFLTFVQKAEKWDLGSEKTPLSLYTVLVAFIAAKVISVFIALPSEATLALGGLFFFISDLFMGVWNYYKDDFKYLALNRIIYFCGKLFLAFSLLL